MDTAAIRSWLLQQPRPVIVRLTTEDSATHELDVGNQSWAKLAASCAALQPILLEAYDSAKKLIRATRTDETATADTKTSAPVVASLARDPETARFELFARLLADAYKTSSETAFNKLVELYEVQVAAMGAVNKEVENLLRLLRREWEEKLQAAESANDGELDTVVGNMVSAALSNTNGAGASNGKV